MVRAYEQEHTFRHPWDRVASASWRKFTDPDTPSVLSHILSVHTLSRRLDPSSGRLLTLRSITLRAPSLPFLLPPSSSSPLVCHCIETSLVDPRARSMEIVALNATLRGLIEVEERSSYSPHPDNPDAWTLLRQNTTIRCKPLRALAAPLAEKLEQRCVDRFQRNSAKGRDFLDRICSYLEAEAAAVAAS